MGLCKGGEKHSNKELTTASVTPLIWIEMHTVCEEVWYHQCVHAVVPCWGWEHSGLKHYLSLFWKGGREVAEKLCRRPQFSPLWQWCGLETWDSDKDLTSSSNDWCPWHPIFTLQFGVFYSTVVSASKMYLSVCGLLPSRAIVAQEHVLVH